jgi:hypothetical protein
MRFPIAACLLLAGTLALADDPKPAAPAETPSADNPAGVEMNDRERAFQQMLSGVRMKGAFTVVGRPMPGGPKEESYEISRVAKVNGDNWLILARAKWGGNDVTLPFPVRVVWAEDTPVITLTDVGFPGLDGKFSCRVLFRDTRYAGTWMHGRTGGHMFGTLEKLDTAQPGEAATPKKPRAE